MDPLRRLASSPLQGDPTSSPAEPVLRCALDERVQHLMDFYRRVETERMQGLPLLNPALRVEAVGFRLAEEDASVAEGVLITPWFMSLLRLPAQRLHAQPRMQQAQALQARAADGLEAPFQRRRPVAQVRHVRAP